MAYGYRSLPAASRNDLDRISDYLEQFSPDLVTNFVKGLHNRCQVIAKNPLMGRARPELTPGLRSHPFDRYILYYVPLPNETIEVIRILHMKQDQERRFNE